MDMSFANCWDCPVSLLSVVGQLVTIALLIAIGFWLLSTRLSALRAVGMIIAVLSYIIALTFAFKVPNWGIINPFADRFAIFSRLIARTIYFTFDVAVLLAFTLGAAARDRRSRKAPHRM
jgi:hypothetical protein